MTRRHDKTEWFVAAALAVAVWLAPAAFGAVVQTVEGRLEGDLVVRADGITVGEQAVKWDDVLFLIADPSMQLLPAAESVRLRNGEIWPAAITGLAGDKLAFRSLLFGRREIDVAQVLALDFQPGLPSAAGLSGETMYRTEGEPAPGRILWIEPAWQGGTVAIDTPLGAVTLRRQGLKRYVFTAEPTEPPAGVERITLVDGSVFYGRLRPGEEGIEIDHDVLGAMRVSPGVLQSVIRRPPSVTYLTEVTPQWIKSFPLIGSPAPSPETEIVPGGGTERFVAAIRVWPKTVVTYKVAPSGGKERLFRATLQIAEPEGHAVRVRVRAGERSLFDQPVGPDQPEPLAVSVVVPADAAEFSLEVDFGTPVRFPGSVMVGDPHLVLK